MEDENSIKKIFKQSRAIEFMQKEELQEEVKEVGTTAFEMSNISLKLNSYLDIFSDFDPREFSEKALSVDFIEEAKRASRDKVSGQLTLRLLMPKKLRNLDKEKVIKKRLIEHFAKHAKTEKSEYKKTFRSGIWFIIAGIVTMILAAFFIYESAQANKFMHFLLIVFEPAGWFLFWEGLNQAIFESKKFKPEYEFNAKLSKCEIEFISY